MPMVALLLSTALAASPAFYHPDDIAARSEQFAAASAQVGPRFETASAEVERLEGLVRDLELSVDLLGNLASEGLRAWSLSNRRALTGQFLMLNQAVGGVQEDFSTAFGAALERALPGVSKGRSVRECGASGIAALMRRNTCEGEDLNPALAKALDADAALRAELAEIVARPWPEVRLEPGPQAPVALTGTARSVQIAAVADRFARARVQERRDALEAGLEQLAEGIEAKDPGAMARAAALRAERSKGLIADGEVLRAAVAEALARVEKKGGPGPVAWCPNPEGLGGCGVPDATAEVLGLLASDKKFLAAVQTLEP